MTISIHSSLPTWEHEKRWSENGSRLMVGVDEAGRGPWAGPVVSAAAVFLGDFPQRGSALFEELERHVRDSKSLSEERRERSYEFVKQHFLWSVGMVSSLDIDRMNIREATFLSMRRALQSLFHQLNFSEKYGGELSSVAVLVDGNATIPGLPEGVRQHAIIRGDGSSFSIAAASILAKVTRDRLMIDIDRRYPQFGFAKHKGYGTLLHRNALEHYGPCPEHRESFRPVLLRKNRHRSPVLTVIEPTFATEKKN